MEDSALVGMGATILDGATVCTYHVLPDIVTIEHALRIIERVIYSSECCCHPEKNCSPDECVHMIVSECQHYEHDEGLLGAESICL